MYARLRMRLRMRVHTYTYTLLQSFIRDGKHNENSETCNLRVQHLNELCVYRRATSCMDTRIPKKHVLARAPNLRESVSRESRSRKKKTVDRSSPCTVQKKRPRSRARGPPGCMSKHGDFS